MRKILFLILIYGVMIFLPLVGNAQITIAQIMTNIVYNVAWPVALAAVIIFWLLTGVLYLSASGDPSKINLANKALIASIAGTIVIILASSIIAIIKNTLGI